jgi:hypothetical protein
MSYGTRGILVSLPTCLDFRVVDDDGSLASFRASVGTGQPGSQPKDGECKDRESGEPLQRSGNLDCAYGVAEPPAHRSLHWPVAGEVCEYGLVRQRIFNKSESAMSAL